MTKALTHALRSLIAAESTWTITMTKDDYVTALELEQLGLVKFKPRLVQHGKFSGLPNGHDVVVTPAGKQHLQGVKS